MPKNLIEFDIDSKLFFNNYKVVLEAQSSSTIVTDGLICHLDGANYSGSGNWMDQTINHYDFIREGSLSWSSDNGGKVIMPGSTGNGLYNTSINLTSTAFTIITGMKFLSYQGKAFSGGGINFQIGTEARWPFWYANGFVINSGSADLNWNIAAVSLDSSQSNPYMYINNISQICNAGGYGGPSGLYLGCYQNGDPWANIEIGFFLVYDKVLSESEMTQNYNYFKDRYGL